MNDAHVPFEGCVLCDRCVTVDSRDAFVVEMFTGRHEAVPRCRTRASDAEHIALVGDNGNRKMV